jgi:para-nitrobenzyl esterase
MAGGFPLSAQGFTAAVSRAYGPLAEAIQLEYPLSQERDPIYTLAALRSDQMIICPSFAAADRLAAYTSVSTFEFADRTVPPFKSLGVSIPSTPGFEAGAGHTTELQYLFGYKAAAYPLSEAQSQLADEMVRSWVAFGRANSSGWWKPYRPTDRQTTIIDLPESGGVRSSADAYSRHHCAFWANHPEMPNALLP